MAYPPYTGTAPDTDTEIICPGCTRLLVQITNQQVVITFGQSPASMPQAYPPIYGSPEPFLPLVGEIVRPFDAFKIRALIPAADLPAGQNQAYVSLVPLP